MLREFKGVVMLRHFLLPKNFVQCLLCAFSFADNKVQYNFFPVTIVYTLDFSFTGMVKYVTGF